MRGLQPLGPSRTTLEIIIPSQSGLTPEKWKETATLCPLDWPSNYSLLRLWHTNGSLHQTEARLRNQLSHSHMFAEWTVHLPRFAERVLFQQPAVYVAGHALQTNLRERNFQTGKSAGGFLRQTWSIIKGRSKRFCSVPLPNKEGTQSRLDSPTNGTTLSHQIKSIIWNISREVWHDPTLAPIHFPLNLMVTTPSLLFSPLFLSHS